MKMSIIGATRGLALELQEFFTILKAGGNDYRLSISVNETQVLYDLKLDMRDLVIEQVLDGISLHRKYQASDHIYIELDRCVEVKINN